ncbi:MAG TPA: site-specific DNA-methyltransferase [bacterium]|nr:site-specific DNA-methyltransferase [bacterium]
MEALQKFQSLLKDLFQFDSSDLDFGIYRILNYKRREIEDFIQNKLPAIVDEAFEKHKNGILRNIDQEFEKAKQEIIKNFGNEAITSIGELKEEFKNTPLGKKYLEIKAQKEEADKIDEIKLQVFNDLYNFFSRYYEEGDFTPQYRYSIKTHKYAIPYNGEEVKLYWANSEQYYTKTGFLFRDYTFKAGDYRVLFRTETAEEELSTNKQKEKQKRFILSNKKLEIDENKKEVVVYFKYKFLSEEEVKKLNNKVKDEKDNNNEEDKKDQLPKQEKINQVIFEEIKEILQAQKQFYLLKDLIEETKNEKPVLLYHINRFTAKNTRDFFIHKNLKRFLEEQLDYFIKAEVLDIKTLEEEKFLDKHITRAKVVREIGEKIIDFLSQIEDFQKKLWEKKKFVIRTDYVITLDRIKEWTDEKFLDEVIEAVLRNENQLKEWEELGFGEIKNKKDLENKKLPIDTRYFDEEFKFKLLEKISEKYDLDDILDGVLIKSENWQALNLLLNKYKERVQTIYIDPPFNKEQDADYLYNVKYKDSTWISMLENRLRLARDLLNDRGSIFVRCDYNGNWIVRPLMNEIFDEENFRNEISINRKRQAIGTPEKFEVESEWLFLFSKTGQYLRKDLYKSRSLTDFKWTGFLKQEERKPAERIFFGKVLYPPPGQHFSLIQEKVDKLLKEHYLRLKCRECDAIYYWDEKERKENFIEYIMQTKEKFKFADIFSTTKVYGVKKIEVCLNCKSDNWKVEYLTSEEQKITDNWKDIPSYSDGWNFQTENSEILLKRVIESTSNENDLVMDFFLGSGTTTAVAHKLKRKWIGIEMGDHFWTVILPRMKKVLAYDKSGISKEKDVKEKYNEKNAGGFFKYQTFEQYEDCLDNIELKENKKAQELFKDEYLLKYFLDFETRESEYLLNIEKLKNPFAYKLKIYEGSEPKEVIVDIPETFNYLLGLKVKRMKIRYNEGKRYLFILGEKEGRDFAIVWREFDDNWIEELNEIKEKEDTKEEINYKKFKIYKDKKFIKKELKEWKPQVVYVNGQSVLTQSFDDFQAEIRYIEAEFKKLIEPDFKS